MNEDGWVLVDLEGSSQPLRLSSFRRGVEVFRWRVDNPREARFSLGDVELEREEKRKKDEEERDETRRTLLHSNVTQLIQQRRLPYVRHSQHHDLHIENRILVLGSEGYEKERRQG